MYNYSELLPHIEGSDYENHFWNVIRGKNGHKEHVNKGTDTATGGYTLTPKGQDKYIAAVKRESLFRSIATDITAYNARYNIKTVSGEDVAVWVPEGGAIPITDSMEDFGDIALDSHKLAVFLQLEEDFVHDATFKIEDYLVSRLAKNFGRAEDKAFINGTGKDEPLGILAENGGADIGVTTTAITYEDVVKLFFSVKPEYRRNGVWLMNDETAMALRTLEGMPIVYDQPTTINDPAGKYIEIIRSGALDGADLSDARLLYNHDLNKVPLARTPKTMQFIKDAAGLKMVATLPDTVEAKSVHTAVKRGDLSGMSFAFKVPEGGDKYNPKTNTREIFKIEKVYEVSCVPFPAYPQTSIEARSAIQSFNTDERKQAVIKANKIIMKEVF